MAVLYTSSHRCKQRAATMGGDDGVVCSICLAEPRRPVLTPSNQTFCRECISLWLAHKPTCPNTQAPLTIHDLRPAPDATVCPSASSLELVVVPMGDPSANTDGTTVDSNAANSFPISLQPQSTRGEELLWVGVSAPQTNDDTDTTVFVHPIMSPLMRATLALSMVTEMHLQVLLGVIISRRITATGGVRQNITNNVGDLYQEHPYRPFLAVYASSTVPLLVFNWAVQQTCVVLLLRRGVRWHTVLTLQLVPALASNVLTAAVMPTRFLCGASVTTTALLTRCVLEKLHRADARLGRASKFLVACYGAFFIVLFVAGLNPNVTNLGHLYGVAWVVVHRALLSGAGRTCMKHALTYAGFAYLTVIPAVLFALPRNVRIVHDDAVSTHIGPACVLFGCDIGSIFS